MMVNVINRPERMVKNERIERCINRLLYVANCLSLVPFYDFATNNLRWQTFGRILNCILLTYTIYTSYCVLSSAMLSITHKKDFVFNSLLIVNYTFQACLVNVSIIFAMFRRKKFAKLLRMFAKLEEIASKPYESNKKSYESNFSCKLFAFSAIVIAVLLADLLRTYNVAPIEVTITCAYLLSLVLIYHTLLILYVTFVTIANCKIRYVNETIRGVNVTINDKGEVITRRSETITRKNKFKPAYNYVLIKSLIKVYKNVNYLVRLINVIFELPLLIFFLVFASNILIFIHVNTLTSHKIYGISFYVHDIVSSS